jgi:ankyrin repeat protein
MQSYLIAENNHPEVVKLLLTDDRVDPYMGLERSYFKGSIDVLEILLSDHLLNTTDKNRAIRYLARYSGNKALSILRTLLSDPNVDPSIDDNAAIKDAATDGNVGVVRLLLESSKVDPSAGDNHALKWAAYNGHTEVVRLLLESGQVDPTAGNNFALRMAQKKGYTDIVRLLEEYI